jgi:predicted transcriptional regulator
MNKAVLLSIKPNLCGLIANSKKTIEIRKTKPKIEVPFKVYIYCTQGDKSLIRDDEDEKLYFNPECSNMNDIILNGKVIGEFICDRIDKYESEFCNSDCYEDIRTIFLDEDGEEDFEKIWDNEDDNYENFVFPNSCVSYQELKKYIGIGIKIFYAWHISNLLIYDKPKELSEFKKLCKHNDCIGKDCKQASLSIYRDYFGNDEFIFHCCDNYVKKPPQSCCYVEELCE